MMSKYDKVEFAEDENVKKYYDVIDKFLFDVLSIPVGNVAFISDRSSIFDFIPQGFERAEFLMHMIAEFNTHYNIDISDIEDGNLIKIAERIYK